MAVFFDVVLWLLFAAINTTQFWFLMDLRVKFWDLYHRVDELENNPKSPRAQLVWRVESLERKVGEILAAQANEYQDIPTNLDRRLAALEEHLRRLQMQMDKHL